jgi:hypothetical protein
MIKEMTIEEKADKLTTYFCDKYGEDRALIIATKIGPGITTMSLTDLIKAGEKWHYANLFFNGKITGEAMKKAFQELGYENR